MDTNSSNIAAKVFQRVLYVEDNEIVREVTEELLAQDGREIVAMATAEEALEAFRRISFDIVITDVSLPVMSGLDLARQIVLIRPGTPIIVASGYALNSALEGLGPNVRAILKPFDTSNIDTLIAELCPAVPA